MRISDWSSDVCSSDLLFGNAPYGLRDRVVIDGITNLVAGGGIARVDAHFQIQDQRSRQLSLPAVHTDDSVDLQTANENFVHGFVAQTAASGMRRSASGQRGVVTDRKSTRLNSSH